MRKIYVVDTSVLISDPTFYKKYTESDICLPVVVLNELDKLKKNPGESGRNARVCIKLLDEISERGDIGTGVLLENDVLLKVDTLYRSVDDFNLGEPTYGDTQILMCLIALWKESLDHNVVLISNDINLRIKAKARGIEAIGHETDHKAPSDLYSGVQIVIDEFAGADLQQNGYIDPRLYGLKLYPHECVLFQDEEGNGIALGRKVAFDKLKLVKKVYPYGISSKNKEQAFAIDLMMDSEVELVTLCGKSGTGKSLLALATAADQVFNQRIYDKLIIYRPVSTIDSGIGFLPGSTEEKLAPFYAAIIDNFEVLLGTKCKANLDYLQRKGLLEFSPVSYIRGRSLPNCLIIIDEAQNFSREQIKTILTRVGQGSKVILNGDFFQIDEKNLDITNTGLIYVIEKFKNLDLAGHITLSAGERSKLATIASEVL